MKEVLRWPADWSFLPRRLLWQFGGAFCVLVLGGLTVSEWGAPTDAQGTGTAVVVRVIDGDTIVVQVEGTNQRVRLMGVDTPETKHPARPVEYYGPEAAAFTEGHLSGATVGLSVDLTGDREDAYGWLLRYVTVEGVDFNAALVRDRVRARGPGVSLCAAGGVHRARRCGAIARGWRVGAAKRTVTGVQ